MLKTLGLAIALAAPAADDGGPVETDPSVVLCAHRAFRIPIELGPARSPDVSGIRLFVSTDEGKTWTNHLEGAADLDVVTYSATADGAHWFVIALVGADGRQVPERIEDVEPGLKVLVDTKRPDLSLRPVRSKSGKRGLRWEVSDENLDASSLRVAVWNGETEGWRPFELPPGERKLAWFEEGTNVRKIQGVVRDKAGNETVLEVNIDGDRFSKRTVDSFVLGAAGDPPRTDASVPSESSRVNAKDSASFVKAEKIPTAIPRSARYGIEQAGHTEPAPPAALETPTSNLSVSRSRRITINYALDEGDDVDRRVELWGTRDRGQTWRRLAFDPDGQSPIEAELEEEGVWGLHILIASSSTAESVPAGREPDFYVEVDTQPPAVEVAEPELRAGQVILRWTALDKNLAERPIDLLGARAPGGPWKKIASRVPNNGEYIWNFARDGVHGPMFFRVRARDRAGNLGWADSTRETALRIEPTRARAVHIAPGVESAGNESAGP